VPPGVPIAVKSVYDAIVATPEITGALSAGAVPNTAAPLPVSSDSTPANCADVVLAKNASALFCVQRDRMHAVVVWRQP
jgi:hypothetical protein